VGEGESPRPAPWAMRRGHWQEASPRGAQAHPELGTPRGSLRGAVSKSGSLSSLPEPRITPGVPRDMSKPLERRSRVPPWTSARLAQSQLQSQSESQSESAVAGTVAVTVAAAVGGAVTATGAVTRSGMHEASPRVRTPPRPLAASASTRAQSQSQKQPQSQPQ